ncbi:NAD-dependent epimerase/dehydratase family protein [Helicobacter rodentium]|uniref:NAD-dependent epimerase/dehydratase family protein n=1 Tax=Helicobacter rodentium TaxID=59617 RepID=UPI00047E0750|nr:NAD(P)-dependent oxidoreductase [Helicobacter rodentium]
MKILLTGATGFVGTNFVLQLHKKHEIIALVRKDSDTSRVEKFCKIYRYDGDMQKFSNILKKENIDGVVHLATLYIKNHENYQVSSLIESNIVFGAELLEILYMIDFEGWFINVGTFWQFYKNLSNNPLNLYAATKTAFLRIADYYTQVAKFKFTTILLNDTYGPNDCRPKIFNIWLKALKSDEQIKMSGGEQVIDILYISDVIDAFEICIDLLEKKEGVLLHNRKIALHSKERKTLKDIAKIFEKCFGKEIDINWGALPYSLRENFMPYESGDKLPQWEQKITFEQGFEMMKDCHN